DVLESTAGGEDGGSHFPTRSVNPRPQGENARRPLPPGGDVDPLGRAGGFVVSGPPSAPLDLNLLNILDPLRLLRVIILTRAAKLTVHRPEATPPQAAP